MEESKKELSSAELATRRDALWIKTGQLQFNKAIAEAELLQANQEILEISNKLHKSFKAATPAPKIVPTENIEVVVEKTITPAEIAQVIQAQ